MTNFEKWDNPATLEDIKRQIEEIKENLLPYIGTPRKAPTKKRLTAEERENMRELVERLEELADKAEQAEGKPLAADNYFLAVSKLAKNAVQLINENGGALIVDKRKNIAVRVEVGAYDALQVPDKYTGYMDAVQMTIGSLRDCGAQFVTAEQVYRTMNGLTTADKVTPQAVGAVTKAIIQMRNLWVSIDRTEEVKSYKKLSGIEQVLQERVILNYSERIKIVNQAGRELIAYKITELPPLYEYSKDRGEIRSLPGVLLNIKGLNTSKQNTAIKIWLLQQIESMKPGKNGKHRDNTIKIDTLFEALKYDISFNPSSPRADKAKYIKQIKKMLEHWAACGYIKGYKENRGGRGNKIESVTIFLPDQK